MSKILEKVIQLHDIDKDDNDLLNKILFIYIFSFIIFGTLTILALIDIYFHDDAFALIKITISILQIINMYFFIKFNNIKITIDILNFLTYALLTLFLIYGGIEDTGIYWIFIFPIVLYFIESKYSLRWMSLFLLTLLIIWILDSFNIINTAYTFLEYRQAFFIFIVVSILLRFYQNTILRQKKELLESENSLRKQIINVELALKSKSEFLANMSHEVRTPLNAIMGFIELLQENEKDETKKKYLNIVNSSSESLLKIINDILDFSKIESGNLQIDKIDFDPLKELSLTKKLFKVRFEEKNIKFFSNQPEIPSSLNGDILRIKQVVNNLLSNAIKFTDEYKNIYFDVEYKDEQLYISVRDEGIGISQKYQNKIFEAFTQEDSSTTRKYGGTGLGLSISYNLVKAMGGELKLESKLGEGSKFYFSIPMLIGKNIKKVEPKKLTEKFSGHILLVEDNKANQMFMKILLKKLGLSFDIANDGVEAVEKFKENKYDIVLMDENMPNKNGIEATKDIILYEKDNSLLHTIIIALTSNALKGDRERFLDIGMDEYLTKPLNKKRLTETLNKFL